METTALNSEIGDQMMSYSRHFFEGQRVGSIESARVVVPILIDLIAPGSVADIGCGTGTWLSVFKENGIEDIRGLDGDYVPTDMLMIPTDAFQPADLRSHIETDRTFDLAMSLEVGEHLPTESSEALVKTLTDRAPVVAFSAAIPLQGGANHINEQWQSFWCERFAACGYIPCDAVRPRIWHEPGVAFWYAQNLIVYVDENKIDDYPKLKEARAGADERLMDIVHPALLHHRNEMPLRPTFELLKWTARLSYGRMKKALGGKRNS